MATLRVGVLLALLASLGWFSSALAEKPSHNPSLQQTFPDLYRKKPAPLLPKEVVENWVQGQVVKFGAVKFHTDSAYRSADYSRQQGWLKQFEQRLRRQLRHTPPLTPRIKQVKMLERKAKVRVSWQTSAAMRDLHGDMGHKGEIHHFGFRADYLDTWVRGKPGWRLKKRQPLHASETLDGRAPMGLPG